MCKTSGEARRLEARRRGEVYTRRGEEIGGGEAKRRGVKRGGEGEGGQRKEKRQARRVAGFCEDVVRW